MTAMKKDEQVIEALRHDAYDARTLDPARVITGAKRRRARARITTGVASAAVAAVAVTGFIAADGLGGATTGQPPVAGGPDPVGPPTTAAAKSEPTTATRARPQVVGKWVPGGPIGAKPIGTIPRTGKQLIARDYWFETKGTRWCVTTRDEEFGNLYEPFGCRATLGNTNITPELSSMQGSGRLHSSVFRGDARRVIYTEGNKYFEGKLYRLAAVTGWMVAVVEFPASEGGRATPRTDQAVFAYDKGGKLIGRFPSAKDGGPTTDPLHGK